MGSSKEMMIANSPCRSPSAASINFRDNARGRERRHLERVGIVALLGFGLLAWLSLVIHIERLPFEIAMGLALLAALGLTRFAVRLRRY